MNFHSSGNKTKFHVKGCAPRLGDYPAYSSLQKLNCVHRRIPWNQDSILAFVFDTKSVQRVLKTKMVHENYFIEVVVFLYGDSRFLFPFNKISTATVA